MDAETDWLDRAAAEARQQPMLLRYGVLGLLVGTVTAAALSTASVLLALALITAVRNRHEVDREAEIRSNIAVIDALPSFAGVMRVGMRSYPVKVPERFGSQLVGNRTEVLFRAPIGTRTRELGAFYDDSLARDGWRVQSQEIAPHRWPYGSRCYERAAGRACFHLGDLQETTRFFTVSVSTQ